MTDLNCTKTPTESQVRRFQRTVEDFKCGNCGAEVKGNGYTNHCPNCLWSKHVDINPGDRMSGCEGMMRPISAEYQAAKFTVVSQCVKCNTTKRNKASEMDDIALLIELVPKL